MQCKTKMTVDKLWLLLSLLLVIMAVSAAGRTNKYLHRNLLIKKILAGKRSGFPWKSHRRISNVLTKIQAGRRSPGSPYPYTSQYAAYAPSPAPAPPPYAPSPPPAPPPYYPSSYPAPSSYASSQYADSPSSQYVSSSYSSPSSYPASPSYYSSSSYPSASYSYPSSYPSSAPLSSQSQQLSYSTPYTSDQYQQYPSQITSSEANSMANSAAYLYPGSSLKPKNDVKKPRPKPTPPDRTEKFEIRGRFFKSIGCWADSPKNRAMESLEGKQAQLKQHDYKMRVNALMKCAEAADEQDLKLFALQNGGQCFGGKNAENTYRKLGPSTECQGDGEGGPYSNEVYSFLDEDDQPLVKPPKILDSKNGTSNSSTPTCPPNPCAANNSSSQTTNTTCGGNQQPGAGQMCGWGCSIQIPGCNVTGTNATSNATGTASKTNQSITTGGCNTSAVGGMPCSPPQQVTPIGGCGGMGTPCPPQGMPMGSSMCGGASMGGSPCVTIDAGCVQVGSQPMGGAAPCPAPAQGMPIGGCPDMGSSCVIQGRLTEGCPNATTGGNPCPPTGNNTAGNNGTRPNGTSTGGPNRISKGGPNGTSTRGPKPTQKCKAKVDLGFIIDGSGSIERYGKGNFKKVLTFVKDLTRSFDVSKEGTHVGVIIYSGEPEVVSGLDQHYTQAEIIAAIEGIKYPNGATDTGKALSKAKDALFDKSARAGVPNIAVVITDGRSRDSIDDPAQQLRDSGVTVISVGIGKNYDKEQLKEMATDPDAQHVFKADFDALDSIVDSIIGISCNAAGGDIQSQLPQNLLPQTKAPETTCKAKMDLAFLLDGSGSIDFQAPGNFKKCLEFLKNFVKAFNIAKDGTHVGLVLFSTTAEVIFSFEKYLDANSMADAISKISYPSKGTNTGKALDLVRTGLFEVSARQGVRDILIIITDGASQDSIDEPSKKLRDMGVTIFSVGIGKGFKKDELDEMATDPDSKHVITGGFDELDQMIPKIKKLCCAAGGGTMSTSPPSTSGSLSGSPSGSATGSMPKINFGVIIDCSASIGKSGKENLKKVLDFVKDLTQRFGVSKDGTNCGLVAYGAEPKVVSGFDQYYTQPELAVAIDGISYLGGATNTGKALLTAKDALFAKGVRAGVPNIACVLTAGKSQDNIGTPAQQLRDSGVTVISVGMGTNYDKEQLREMATDPDSQNMFNAEFDALGSLVSPIQQSCMKVAGAGGSSSSSGVVTLIKGGSSSSAIPTGKKLIRIGTTVIGSKLKQGDGGNVTDDLSAEDVSYENLISDGLLGTDTVSADSPTDGTSGKVVIANNSTEVKKQARNVTGVMGTRDVVKGNIGLRGAGVCRDKVDLAFLLDASGNKGKQGQEHFKTSLEIVKAITSMFVINELQTHVGFVAFSTNSQAVLNFKTYFDQKSIENAVDGIQYMGGNTNIGAGLRIIKNKLFDVTSRKNVPRILIVLTSGKSTEDVIVPSKALRDSGVTVFCIGIGNMYDAKELDEIATDPDVGHVLTTDVTQLGLIVKAIKGKICKANIRPVALFPLNSRYKARDVIGGNPPGESSLVIPAVGPDNKEGGSLSFLGTPDSFIEFPNNGKLDAKNSLTILAWIFPEKAGPIFNFKKDGWGANLWLAQPRKLFAHFVDRSHHKLIQPLHSTKVAPNRWNFIGATYDHTTGEASLWVNGKFDDTKNLGHIELATNYTVRMGARIGDKRNFRGRIACLQVYNVSLTSEQIDNAKDNCKSYKGA